MYVCSELTVRPLGGIDASMDSRVGVSVQKGKGRGHICISTCSDEWPD